MSLSDVHLMFPSMPAWTVSSCMIWCIRLSNDWCEHPEENRKQTFTKCYYEQSSSNIYLMCISECMLQQIIHVVSKYSYTVNNKLMCNIWKRHWVTTIKNCCWETLIRRFIWERSCGQLIDIVFYLQIFMQWTLNMSRHRTLEKHIRWKLWWTVVQKHSCSILIWMFNLNG